METTLAPDRTPAYEHPRPKENWWEIKQDLIDVELPDSATQEQRLAQLFQVEHRINLCANISIGNFSHAEECRIEEPRRHEQRARLRAKVGLPADTFEPYINERSRRGVGTILPCNC